MLELVTLRVRPDLRPQLFAGALESLWPEFMQRDPTAMLYFADAHLDCYLDTAFAIIDPVAPDAAVGRAFAVPFVFEDLPDRTELPDAGWDGVIRWAHRDRTLGRTANALSALEITLLPERRGQGASRVILDAMRDHARSLGYRHMFAPVRPTAKHLEPFTPIGDYVRRRTVEGLPTDPWLRVHVRAGGDIVKVAPASMVIAGSIAEWSRSRAGARVAGAGPRGLCRTQRLGSSLDRLTAPGQRVHSITTVPTLSPRSTASCAAAA